MNTKELEAWMDWQDNLIKNYREETGNQRIDISKRDCIRYIAWLEEKLYHQDKLVKSNNKDRLIDLLLKEVKLFWELEMTHHLNEKELKELDDLLIEQYPKNEKNQDK